MASWFFWFFAILNHVNISMSCIKYSYWLTNIFHKHVCMYIPIHKFPYLFDVPSSTKTIIKYKHHILKIYWYFNFTGVPHYYCSMYFRIFLRSYICRQRALTNHRFLFVYIILSLFQNHRYLFVITFLTVPETTARPLYVSLA